MKKFTFKQKTVTFYDPCQPPNRNLVSINICTIEADIIKITPIEGENSIDIEFFRNKIDKNALYNQRKIKINKSDIVIFEDKNVIYGEKFNSFLSSKEVAVQSTDYIDYDSDIYGIL